MDGGNDPDITSVPEAADAPDAASGTWGEFQLVEELGRGAFGRVYRAWDATLAQDVALKIIQLPDPTRLAATLDEGQMLARVRHRNVVTVYGAHRIDDEVGFWMELIQGRPLEEIIREEGPMGPEEATVVGISVCQALAAVHAAGLLHRDIKANNIMREEGGRIVLMDFGTGRELGPTHEADFAGTPAYMAPEVLNGQDASVQSDLYSVGVLLYHVVTRDYPVTGKSVVDLALAHQRGRRRRLSDVRSDLPAGFVRVVERALSPAASSRPASAGEMMRELAAIRPLSASSEARLVEALQQAGVEPAGVLGQSAGHAEPAVSAQRVLPWGLAAAGVVVAIGLLGFLTSAAFNQSLARGRDFSDDRPQMWLEFGARSLAAPAILAALIFVLVRLLVTGWQAVLRLARPVSVLAGRVRVLWNQLLHGIGATSVSRVAQWLLLLQILAVATVWVSFRGFIEALIWPSVADSALLRLLADDSMTAPLFRAVLTVVLVAMTTAWFGLLSKPDARAEIPRTTIAAGTVVIVLALLMLVVPYRLLYHNEVKRTDFEGARCYEIGASVTKVLLFCPDSPPPRIKSVNADDPQLRPTDIHEKSMFSAAPVSQ